MDSMALQNGEPRRYRVPTFTLADVVINSDLACRLSRAPDYQGENEALNILAQTLAHSPQNVLQKLVEVAQRLCRADSAGISLVEKHDGE
jgi:hypothetical protein